MSPDYPLNIVFLLQNVSTLNSSYTNGTNTLYEDEWQAYTSNVNTISNLKCSYDNYTNISYKDEWQQYKPDLDITDIIIRCVLTPLFLLIGLGGNASTIIVFHRQLKRGPTVLFILALAYCDFSFSLTSPACHRLCLASNVHTRDSKIRQTEFLLLGSIVEHLSEGRRVVCHTNCGRKNCRRVVSLQHSRDFDKEKGKMHHNLYHHCSINR